MGNKLNILIVDDHVILREGVRALLSTQRSLKVVGEANNGEEAIAKVSELSPDVVIMDIGMPVMGGMEATRRITRAFPEVKVLILTQYNDRQYVQSSLKAGAHGCIPKEALPTDLITAIRSVSRGETYLHRSMVLTLAEPVEAANRTPEDPDTVLTARELEVVKLIAQNYSNSEIAETLYLSVNTVLNHKKRIMAKLQIHHRNDIVKYAIRTGLVSMFI